MVLVIWPETFLAVFVCVYVCVGDIFVFTSFKQNITDIDIFQERINVKIVIGNLVGVEVEMYIEKKLQTVFCVYFFTWNYLQFSRQRAHNFSEWMWFNNIYSLYVTQVKQEAFSFEGAKVKLKQSTELLFVVNYLLISIRRRTKFNWCFFFLF